MGAIAELAIALTDYIRAELVVAKGGVFALAATLVLLLLAAFFLAAALVLVLGALYLALRAGVGSPWAALLTALVSLMFAGGLCAVAQHRSKL